MNSNWEELKLNVANCCKCDGAVEPAIGRGEESARILFVLDKPEDEKVTQLLGLLFEACGLDKESYYITSVVKCKSAGIEGTGDSKINVCLDYLRNQFSLIKPKVVVCLGEIAAWTLFKKNIDFVPQRGEFVRVKNSSTCFIETCHPDEILNNSEKSRKMKTSLFEDIIKVKELELR